MKTETLQLLKRKEVGFFIILIIFLVIWGSLLYLQKAPGNKAAVYLNNKLETIIDLKDNKEYYFESIKVIVNDNKIFVDQADCPNQICVKTPAISYVGQTIACLPNGFIIRIIGDDIDIVIQR